MLNIQINVSMKKEIKIISLQLCQTIITVNGYRFYFYSNKNSEPIHVHIEKAEGNAKYWLDPIEEVYSYDFTSRQRKEIGKLVREYNKTLKKAWHEYFG